MSERNGFSELAKLTFRYQGQKEKLKQKLLEKYTQEILIDLLTHEITPTRRAASYALSLIGDTKAIPPLVETLKHDDLGTSVNAEKALWAIWFRSGDESVDAMLQEGTKKIEKKQYEEGIQILSEVIQLAPEFAEGYNQRAVVYFMLEEWQKSIDDCQKTVELNPYHFGALAGMGHCYIRLGDLKAAMQAYQRALEINPNLYEIADTLLRIQEALRQHFEE